jgi:hypothetical protein
MSHLLTSTIHTGYITSALDGGGGEWPSFTPQLIGDCKISKVDTRVSTDTGDQTLRLPNQMRSPCTGYITSALDGGGGEWPSLTPQLIGDCKISKVGTRVSTDTGDQTLRLPNQMRSPCTLQFFAFLLFAMLRGQLLITDVIPWLLCADMLLLSHKCSF